MTRKALILDDDPAILMLLEKELTERHPDLEVACRAEPHLDDKYDVYILDNDFDGVERCAEMAERIRIANPDSLIIAFSSCLNVPMLTRSSALESWSSSGLPAIERNHRLRFLARHPVGARDDRPGERLAQQASVARAMILFAPAR
jgi:hypothetical protein